MIPDWIDELDKRVAARDRYYPLRREDCVRLLAAVKELRDIHRWRPISELHEDYGQCVLINIADPGHVVMGNNLDAWFDETDWTHFARITPLSIETERELMGMSQAETPMETRAEMPGGFQ